MATHSSRASRLRSDPFFFYAINALFIGFWITVLWFAGLERHLLNPDPAPKFLTETLSAWTRRPLNQHWFLPTSGVIQGGTPTYYSNYALAFYLPVTAFVYVTAKLRQCSLAVAENQIIIFYLLFPVAVFVDAIRRLTGKSVDRTSPKWLFIAFLSWGILLTCPTYILSVAKYHPDNFHVIATMLFTWLSLFCFEGSSVFNRAYGALLLIALISPFYFPVALLFFLAYSRATRPELRKLAFAFGTAVFSWFLPKALGSLSGLIEISSGYLFRSGLDGDTRYFGSLWQTVFFPYSQHQRLWEMLPPLGWLISAVGIVLWLSRGKDEKQKYLSQLIVMLLPLFYVVTFFPQFTSIHVYFADNHFYWAVSFAIAFWSLTDLFQSVLRGVTLVLWQLFLGAIIMTNLLALVRNLGR